MRLLAIRSVQVSSALQIVSRLNSCHFCHSFLFVVVVVGAVVAVMLNGACMLID